jgi:hypothetical protein
MEIRYIGDPDYSEEKTMNSILLVIYWLVIVHAPFYLLVHPVEASFSSERITKSVRFAQCFRDAELSERLATLKLQGGVEVAKVYESLLTKARTSSECRTELVYALIRVLQQANHVRTDPNDEFFLWQHGAGLLAELKATEALDLLVANIELSSGWSSSISPYHLPVLAAVLSIGLPAIPKLEIVLRNDSDPARRKFAALAIAYIGGSQARRALTGALQGETDSCVKNFLRVSLQAFNNKTEPNHISPALNGKWLSAFYCL